MSKLISVGAAGALALGSVAAHATIQTPGAGSSDAILFAEVVNAAGTAAVASYAGDTGVSINSIVGGTFVSGTTFLGTDANLQKLFAADAAGDTLYYAVLGGQYTGSPNIQNFKTAGVAQFVTTVANNNTTALNGGTTGSLTKFAGLNTDITTINSNIGSATTIEGTNPATSGVWDVTNVNGLAYWDGGSISNGSVLGTAENLYYVTGTGGVASKLSPVLEGSASLSAAGLKLTANGGGGGGGGTVPLPAAVWLLGSGLVGLAGVARRKAKA